VPFEVMLEIGIAGGRTAAALTTRRPRWRAAARECGRCNSSASSVYEGLGIQGNTEADAPPAAR